MTRINQVVSVIAVSTVALAMPSSDVCAQSAPIKTLAKPDVELKETLTSIVNVRELSDGRVIASDSRDKLVLLADFRKQTLTKIGREGSGPAEYKSPGRLYALRGDTTLLNDFANNRFLVITGDGKAAGTRSIETGPIVGNTGMIGVDELGRMYLSLRASTSPDEGGPQNVLRYTPDTKRVDTLTTYTLPAGRRSGAMMLGNGMLKMFTNLPLALEDVVAVSPDGRVAVAHASDYHVEWTAMPKQHVSGQPIAYEPIRVSAAEKRSFLEHQIRPGSIVVRDNGAGGKAAPIKDAAIPKGAASPGALDDTGMQWPDRKPPFPTGAASVDRLGRLWLLRTVAHDDSVPHYDVFDANAKLIMQVRLPANTTLVGFGNKTVYLTRADDDDLKILQRYVSP